MVHPEQVNKEEHNIENGKQKDKAQNATLFKRKISLQEVEVVITEMELGVAHGTDGVAIEILKKEARMLLCLFGN